MSKYLHVPNGDYKIEVQYGGRITLDTGTSVGQVRITGDLVVDGVQTIVNTEIMEIEDNIIVLNKNETGAGISADTAGIEIERGTRPNALFLFDENISWATGGPLYSGAFKTGWDSSNNSGIVALQTNCIVTPGGNDLYLINSGTGVITVTGTNNYENQVTDDDDIPNKRYVDDAIVTALSSTLLTQIGSGVIDPTTVKVLDNETTGTDSRVEVAIDNQVVANIYQDRFELGDVRIIGTKIETINSNDDLVLSAPGVGAVRIDDTLHINSVPGIDENLSLATTFEPDFPSDGIKLYVNNESTGATGLFFANANLRRDEIISNNRSLIYSMIF